MTEKVGELDVEVVEFDEELFKKNIEENDFSGSKEENKDGKGDDK